MNIALSGVLARILPAGVPVPTWSGLATPANTLTLVLTNVGLNPLTAAALGATIDPAGLVFAPLAGLNAALALALPLPPLGVVSVVVPVEPWNAAELTLTSLAGTTVSVEWRVAPTLAPVASVNGSSLGPVAAAAFAPARTLFVAQSWPVGADPLVYFTSPQSALVQAATLLPTRADPVTLVYGPGEYPGPLTLVSNVHHHALGGRRSVRLTGAVTWTPGSGVNAAQVAADEEIDLVLIVVAGAILVTTTAKAAGLGRAVLDSRDCAFSAGIAWTGRNQPFDYFQAWNAIMLGAPLTFNGCNVNVFSSTTDGYTVGDGRDGGSAVDVRACEIYSPSILGGALAGNCHMEACQINATVDLGGAVAATFTGSLFRSVATLTVAAGGAADARAATLDGIAGAGVIDRTIVLIGVGPSVLGPMPVAIVPPLPSGFYGVSLTQTAGPVGGLPVVSAQTGGGFTLTDSVAGRFFDVTVSRE
jgi:hypothetical protein